MATNDDYSQDSGTTGRLQASGQVSATFEQGGDSDWFRITLAANSYYSFQLAAPTQSVSAGSYGLYLTQPGGGMLSPVWTNMSASGMTGMFKTSVAGDYFLSAANYTYSNTVAYGYTLSAGSAVADDAGDTFQTARAIALRQEVSGTFEGPGDVDAYKLTLVKGVTYSIKHASVDTSSSYPMSLTVTDSAGQAVSSSYGSGATFTAASSGEYYLLASGGNYSGGTSRYTLSADTPADDYGANTTSAGVLRVGSSTKGQLEVSGDKDWYAVTLSANQVYWLTAKPDTATPGGSYSSSQAQLQLFDSTGKLLASESGASSDAVLQYVPTKSGTYYFEVGINGNYGVTGSYLAKAAVGLRDDYGNVKAGAAQIAVGSTTSGKLELYNDTDMFKFSVKAGATYLFELKARDTVGNPYLRLDGQDGNGSSAGMVHHSKADAADYVVYTANYTGDYFLTVDNVSTYGTSGYTLQVTEPAGDELAASTSTTASLSTGGKLASSLDYIGDADWIKVSMVAGNKYAFVLGGKGNGEGTLDTGSGLGSLALVSGPAGSYYYGLVALSGMATPGYRFDCELSGDYYLSVANAGYYGSNLTGSYTVSAYNISGDTAMPAIVAFAPASGSAGASTTGNITLTFNDLVRGGEGGIRLVDSLGNVVETFYLQAGSGRVQMTGNTVTIDPTANLQPGTKYTLEIPAGALLDYAGNKFLADSVYSFTTVIPVAEGGSGNDFLTGIGTSVRLSGGDGIDTVAYGSTWSSYAVSVGPAETKVMYRYGGGVGTGDVLTGIERLQFADRNIALDADGHGGQAYRMYQAAFNRAPDKAGLGFWMSHLDNGMSLQSVAKAFLESAEFQARYGALGNEAFVNSLYTNVLHRAGEAAGVAHWVGKLEQGTARAEVLMGFSESGENVTEILKVIGNGFEYTPYG